MVGQTIGQYKVIEKLGEGGMGVVYKAFDSKHERIVALKVLNRDAALDSDVQRRFMREAGAGAGLVHPNIVQMYDAGHHEGQHYICLEFVDGKNLRDIIDEGIPPSRRVVEIGVAIGDALQLAHDNGVVHRDIKAENIMLTTDGVVKVMDFGLAKVQNASLLTREGDIIGTIAYMSPEQAVGESVDARTDIFSFGVLLYELLAGKLPFWASYETAIVYAILNSEPISIREMKPDVPEALEQIVFKALRKDRQQRYQKMSELIGDLTRVKAYFDGERDVLPSQLELVAGGDVAAKEEVWGSQIKLAARTGFQASLVGREKEFGLLRERLDRAITGEGQVVLLGGEAGIGKTRLVEELESYAKTIRVRMFSGRCSSSVQGTYPYQPFVEAIRSYLNNKEITTPESLETFVTQTASELVPRLPILRTFLDIGEKQDSDLGSREQLWDTLSVLLARIAIERPLVLFIDDLHWADDDSLELLAYLSRNTTKSSLLFLGTYRIEEVRTAGDVKIPPLEQVEQELADSNRFLRLQLERLGASAVREMVSSLFPETDFGTAFYESINTETEGNPFFVVETLKLLKVEGAIEKVDGTFRLKEHYDLLSIPKSIHDIVMRRIDRLKEDEREILEIGAVEGESFHSGTIGACLELGRIRLLKKLQALERDHHIIHPEENTYRFDHGKIREFLYEAITPELRVEYHRMIGDYLAETFPTEEHLAANIAHHFVSGGNEERALPFLVTAGEWSKRLFANKQAVNYYQHALDLICKFELRKAGKDFSREKEVIIEGLADVWSLTGMHHDAIAKYKELSTISGISSLKRTELLRKMGAVYLNIGENEKALEILQLAEKELDERNSRMTQDPDLKKALGKTRITRSRVFKSLGRYDDARKEVEDGLALIRDDANPKELADAYNNLGVIYEDIGAFDLSAEMYEKSLKVREEIGDKMGVAVAHNNLANLFADQGDFRKTAENLKKSLDIMTEIGYRAGIAGTCNNLGSVYQDQGRYDEALRMHERCLAIRKEIGDMPGIAMSYGNIGSVKLDMGDYDGAREDLQKNLEISGQMGFRIFESQVHSWLALALLHLDEVDEAYRIALRAHEIAQEMNQRSQLAAAERTLGIIDLERLAFTRVKSSTGLQSGGHEDPWNSSGNHLQESLAIFQELKMQHEIGRCYVALARFHQYIGEADRCREYLLKSKEIFQKLGAMGDLAAANKVKVTS